MKFLPDTNVFREMGKEMRDTHVANWQATIRDADLAVSAITVRQVRKGIAKIRARKPDTAALDV